VATHTTGDQLKWQCHQFWSVAAIAAVAIDEECCMWHAAWCVSEKGETDTERERKRERKRVCGKVWTL